MKTLFKYRIVSVVFFLLINLVATDEVEAQRITATITYQHFYDGLSPHGIWIDYPGYGHVWHPSVDGNFRPYYTNGYWDYCSDGWIWVSLYDWGWAPFHYGRWLYDDLYGWLWVPGYEWSPAWVIWGDVDEFYAWAPLMPSVNVVIWYGSWRPARIYWNVVARPYIYNRDIGNRGRSNLDDRFYSRIRINNNYGTTRHRNQYYARGPEIGEVERYTNRKIVPVTLRDVKRISSRDRQGNELQVYRPRINNPEPRTYRSLDRERGNPIRSNTDNIKTERTQQNRNIERLPIRKAPVNTRSRENNRVNTSRRNNN
jgi:hypothetical protein